MKGRALVAGLAAVALGLALLAGCSRPGGGPSSAAKESLQPVWLPDLSRMSEPVQQQVREAYASLMRKIENPGSTTAELADAYGEMGKLFMAADHYDAAEACHINAHALAPSDVRWSNA